MKRETYWEVEWYGEPPLDENGESDWDRAPWYSKNFSFKLSALRYAARTVKKTGLDATVTEWWRKPDSYSKIGGREGNLGYKN